MPLNKIPVVVEVAVSQVMEALQVLTHLAVNQVMAELPQLVIDCKKFKKTMTRMQIIMMLIFFKNSK